MDRAMLQSDSKKERKSDLQVNYRIIKGGGERDSPLLKTDMADGCRLRAVVGLIGFEFAFPKTGAIVPPVSYFPFRLIFFHQNSHARTLKVSLMTNEHRLNYAALKYLLLHGSLSLTLSLHSGDQFLLSARHFFSSLYCFVCRVVSYLHLDWIMIRSREQASKCQ
jgi:hypothetical protein